MSGYTPVAFGQMEKSPIEHFSASSLNMLIRCPEQWRQRYVLGRKAPPEAAQLQGSADHRTIAWNFHEKMRTGEDAPVAEVRDRFVHELDERIEEEGGSGEVVWGDSSRDTVIERGVPLTLLYRETVAPYLLPDTVEQEFSIPPADFGLPMRVFGYIDYVMRDFDRLVGETTGPPRIVERKTVGRSQKEPKPDWVVQGRVYQLAAPLPIEYQLSVKTKVPKVQVDPCALTFQPPRAEQTVMFLRQQLEYLAHLMRLYGPESAWPVTGLAHVWACNYCGFRKDCVAWSG